MTALPPFAPLLQKAMQRLGARDFGGAQAILEGLLKAYPDEPNGLHLLGLVRTQQGRPLEAITLLERSVSLSPRHALTWLNLGKLLSQLGRDTDAAAAFGEAVALEPEQAEAQLELGNTLHRLQRLDEAENALRIAARLHPGEARIGLSLGSMLLDKRQFAEADALLRDAIPRTQDAEILGKLWNNLALALRGRGDDAGALQACEFAQARAPQFTHLDAVRADALDAMGRHDEALGILDGVLARDPHNPTAHIHYSSLLYRLGHSQCLMSFDRAPQTAPLRALKAALLVQHRKPAEAEALFARLAAELPDDVDIMTGMATALTMQHRFDEAATWRRKAIARRPADPALQAQLANTLLNARDPRQALAAAQAGHRLAPADQSCLALMSTALRLLGEDEQDERLSGYDTLIRVFDLPPPAGFSSMEDFNAELAGYLDTLHPDTREPLEQSLRGGTQTLNNLFGAGHDLVERVRQCIEEAVSRYIAELSSDESHPFHRRRRSGGGRMLGSWSSRLRDCGFHANHIHPAGWISSCYYVKVPNVAADSQAQQGWIKFGEPSFETGLPARRSIQPVPGRLILFPSYMWHGTTPFQEPTVRTTIAFDMAPG